MKQIPKAMAIGLVGGGALLIAACTAPARDDKGRGDGARCRAEGGSRSFRRTR